MNKTIGSWSGLKYPKSVNAKPVDWKDLPCCLTCECGPHPEPKKVKWEEVWFRYEFWLERFSSLRIARMEFSKWQKKKYEKIQSLVEEQMK